MRLVAIDPGNELSAYVEYRSGDVAAFGKIPNLELLGILSAYGASENRYALAIESIASYGMAVGATVFETCVWSGRFMQRWIDVTGGAAPIRVYRRDVKLHLCNTSRAKDANVRQAIIDRYGPGREKAVGRKASPGPLYGVKADVWQAIAVAITAHETMEG